MAEYINLRKYVKTFTAEEYNPINETGFWRADVLENEAVWYILIPIEEHTIIEPNCKVYKLVNSIFQEFEPFKIIIEPGYNIYLYVKQVISDVGQGKLSGKLLIF